MNERFGIVANARSAWPDSGELAALGAAWIRTIVYSFDELDAVLASHPSEVKVIALLNSENDVVKNDLSGWREAIEQFGARFAGRVHAVECLNEWDLLHIPVETAADCARTAAPILNNAGIACLLGSVAGPSWPDALSRLADSFSAEEKAQFAGACFHPYGKSVNGFPPGFEFGEIEDAVRTANQLAGLPIYLTEYGIKLSDAGGDDGQRAYFEQTFEVLRQIPSDILAAACYFCWTDRIGAPEEQAEHAFGLLRQDDSPRPAHDLCCAIAESGATPFDPITGGPARPAPLTMAEKARVRVFGHTGPYRMQELQVAAYRVAEWAPARPIGIAPDSPIFRYWQTHKDVGPAATSELQIGPGDGGGKAVITTSGRIIRASARNQIEVV
ncbi:MAG: hypothetical protein AB7F89_19185 [Pirellulaceae bacterium]